MGGTIDLANPALAEMADRTSPEKGATHLTFAEAMKEARLYREMNYANVAEVMGRQGSYASYLSGVEKGRLKPNYEIVEKIADGLGVTFNYRPGLGWGWRPAK